MGNDTRYRGRRNRRAALSSRCSLKGNPGVRAQDPRGQRDSDSLV